jgi:type IV pilus assembly protein PilQ
LPDAGLQLVSLNGSGSDYAIEVVPTPGVPLARPVVSADGRNLVITFPTGAQQLIRRTATLNLQEPGRVPQSSFAPPLQPRAVAPPLGDMAVGSMVLANQGFVNLAGPRVTLNLRNAKAIDALQLLARLGGYGFVFVDDRATSASVQSEGRASIGSDQQFQGVAGGQPAGASANASGSAASNLSGTASISNEGAPVTISFVNETYARAVNSVLLAANLQGKLEGNIIFAGPSVLRKTFGSQLSKVYRLNQAPVVFAADYLASLGASITKVTVTTVSVDNSVSSANAGAARGNGAAAVGGGSSQASESKSTTTTETYTYGGGQGPLLGLVGTTDSRLQTITLIGDPKVIALAENYLRQLDLRQRQVALTVRILDVNLSNVSEIDNSFAFRYGSNFIVNDQGRLLAAFGRNLPATSESFDQFETTTKSSASNSSFGESANSSSNRNSSAGRNSSSGSSASTEVADSLEDTYTLSDTYTIDELKAINDVITKSNGTLVYQNPETGVYQLLPIPQNDGSSVLTETNANTVQKIISAITGRNVSASRVNLSTDTRSSASDSESGSNRQSGRASNAQSGKANSQSTSSSTRKRPNPGFNYPDSEFYDFLQAQIVSKTTKILASPTLILQEGAEPYGGSDSTRISADGKVGREKTNEAFVRVGTQYVTSYVVRQDINGNNFCEPVFGNAGLTFGARVDKIDDNGFVTFSLSPEISAAVGQQQIDRCGTIYQINDRLLDTGKVRVRDGQTLILTGVISDDDKTVVSKWPVLGDLPLIGQFFRRTSGDRQKSELVIMVTPRVINDDQGGMYGFGYQPSTQDARSFVYSGS